MFVNPNGAKYVRHSNRYENAGLFRQLELMSDNQSGYRSIRILLLGHSFTVIGGISE